ncbi:MAG: alpha/beta fold hydrolase [Actinomycetota bacterium]
MSPHLVLAHGFTQTARSWDPLRPVVTDRMPSCSFAAVDLPGHGESAARDGDLWVAADHLVERGGHGVYVGYSLGGRVALHAAVAHPDSVDRLVLIGATAGIDDEHERAARRAADEELAARIERDGVESFIDWWLRNPLFAGLDSSIDQRDDRLRNTAVGLASSLRSCGTGTQEPLWDRLGELRTPTLVLVGAEDQKFRDLGERLVAELVDAELVVVPDAGHSVHLEQPGATVDAIADWLRR